MPVPGGQLAYSETSTSAMRSSAPDCGITSSMKPMLSRLTKSFSAAR
jgi:hypothetical protein